jgi:uncharacterized integral membrane protein (TIGR00698 family)
MKSSTAKVVEHHDEMQKPDFSRFYFVGGVLFTFIIALIGTELAKLPWVNHLGPMVTAILLAIGYRQAGGYPQKIHTGIQFTSKKVLRYAIILFGFKLNIDVIINQGLGLLARDVVTILLAMAITMLAAKWLKADASLSLLLAVGTGVCGAAAIAAVSPIVKAKDEDTAIGVGIIALAGTIFTILYTLARPFVHLTNIQYGIWSGISLHEIAHVAAAAAPAGANALAIALLAKLGRVLLLIPLCFGLAFWMRKRDLSEEKVRLEFPWFLVGFMVTSLLGTYILIPKFIMQQLAALSSFLLTAAMVGLGLNVSFQALRTKAWKPLLAMLVASVVLSVYSLISIQL